MSDGKKVGKISAFRLPAKPTWPIEVLDSYDRFFILKLRQAMNADRSRYTHGIVAYHQNLIDVVESYARDKVTSGYLSRENLGNFLRGTDSRTPVLQVVDAYIQIVNPLIRKTFFVSSYKETFGTMLSDYTRPFVDKYERAKAIQEMAGTYYLSDSPDDPQKNTMYKHYVMMRREASDRYLFCYNFSSHIDAVDISDAVLHLFTGFCIPSADQSFVMLRSYKFKSLRVGFINFMNSNQAKARFSLDPSDTTLSVPQMFFGPNAESNLHRMKDEALSAQVEAVVNSFENVF